MSKSQIGFAGLTHLGLNSAVASAERGFNIVCFDENTALIQQLKAGQLPVIEPELPELFSKNQDHLTFTDKAIALKECDIVYIAVDVPTDDAGQSDLSPVNALIEKVVANLHSTALLVILCQVPPGFTRKLEGKLPLERVFYQVETLIFGRAIERALHPERFMIGCFLPSQPLPTRYQNFLEAFNCPILPMRYESAELTKIAINCCLVSSIGVANTLSEICEAINADWFEIVPALKLDKRIGQYAYLSPGLGIAGGNLERDLTTVVQLSNEYGTDTSIVRAWQGNSQYRRDWVLRVLHDYVFNQNPNPKIAVLGLAYKENTHSIKNSPALWLLQWLRGYSVKAFDPGVNLDGQLKIEIASSALDAAKNADVLIIMTPWPEFRALNIKDLSGEMAGRVIIDPYRVLNNKDCKAAGFEYFTLGVKETVC